MGGGTESPGPSWGRDFQILRVLSCSPVCRVLDLVPPRAGKRAALEYVRQRYGFPVERTVACGDSGNDVLMLSGVGVAGG